MKLLKIGDKEKILKVDKKKRHTMYKSKGKTDSRFLIDNNKSEERVEEYL